MKSYKNTVDNMQQKYKGTRTEYIEIMSWTSKSRETSL